MQQNLAQVQIVYLSSPVYLPILFLEIIVKTIWNCLKPVKFII